MIYKFCNYDIIKLNLSIKNQIFDKAKILAWFKCLLDYLQFYLIKTKIVKVAKNAKCIFVRIL